MKFHVTEQEYKILREAINYDELHLRKLAEWEEKFNAPQLQCNIINYLAKKALARKVDLVMSLKIGDNDLTDIQCSGLASILEAKLERDVKATHKLYNRIDAVPTLDNLAKEELLPTFMILDRLRDY